MNGYVTQTLAAAVGLVFLCSCHDRSRELQADEAARILREISSREIPALLQGEQLEPGYAQLFQKTISDFLKTGNAQSVVHDESMDILLLACLFKKPLLVHYLLEKGADPNRRGQESLLLAMDTTLLPDTDSGVIISIVDDLLAHGARFQNQGVRENDFLTKAAYVCGREEVILHLLEKGAQPDQESGLPAALHGWPRLLKALLDSGVPKDNLIHAVAVGSCRFSGQHLQCLQLLLQRGATVNDLQNGIPGCTPLFRLAEELSELPVDLPVVPAALDMLERLLQEGANPSLRCATSGSENMPGLCPFDLLCLQPELQKLLHERGIDITPPPLTFGEKSSTLLADVCRASLVPRDPATLAPFFDRIASVLSASPDLVQQDIFPQAVEAAVSLLARIDALKAADTIVAMPAWQQPFTIDFADTLLHPILSALTQSNIALPADFLSRVAEKAFSAGLEEEASSLVELLGRTPDAREFISRYMNDKRLPLRAGGYAAKLAVLNLPTVCNNGVVEWLLEQGREPDSDFLRHAILLTSWEKLWFGSMTEEEQNRLISSLRHLGASHAADVYAEIAAHLDDAASLDSIMSREQKSGWMYELRIVISRYFLQHRADFAPKSS